jgi:L-fucose isomerase-like protein
MAHIAIYTLTSELHDEQAVSAVTKEFLDGLKQELEFKQDTALGFDLKGNDYSDYGSHALDLIYVRTGGTEGIFKRLLADMREKSDRPFYLLTSGKSNSLAASMEILSYLRQNGMKGEILHGGMTYIAHRIALLVKAGEARRRLNGCRLGIIGEPSDWLISSHADKDIIRKRLGVELVDIPMQELLEAVAATPLRKTDEACPTEAIRKALPGALQIYDALLTVIKRHNLQGFTLRCFDLLSSVHNTGCLALAKLNAEGIVAGCEGDVPAMLSMKIAQALLGVSGFQANPASINPETGEMLFAHCTIPFNLVEHYEFDTHFESGIGVGIRGYMKEGPVTIFKVSGNLLRCFIQEGELMRNQANPDLCRTQQVIQLSDPSKTAYFLNDPIGNHHIILPGHHQELLTTLSLADS